MRILKKTALLSVLLVSLVSTTACNKTVSSISGQANSPYYSITMDGDYIDYPEDHVDVISLKEKADGYVRTSVEKDYTGPINMEEYNYYTKEIYDQYMNIGRAETAAQSALTNELILKMDEINVQSIEFYRLRGHEASSVTTEYISTIHHATDAYLERLGLKQGTKYKRGMTIVFINEEDEWKVESYSLTSREEVK